MAFGINPGDPMWLDEKDRCRAPTPGARAWLTFDAAAQGEFLGDANQNLEPTRLGGSRQPERRRWMETLKMQKRDSLDRGSVTLLRHSATDRDS